MTDVPPPPEELDSDEKAVWRRGFQAGAHFVAGYAQHVAGEMERAESESEPSERNDTCAECEAELIDALGGTVCPNGCDPNGS